MSSIPGEPPASEPNDKVEPKVESQEGNTNENANGDEGASTTEQAIDVEQIKKEFQEKARNYLIEQSQHVVIPSFSKWFDLDKIHSIEEKSFPDFFGENANSYKNPQAYKNMRDFMVNAYRINPIEYLTVTATRRNLAGDVSTIIRIHQFLEKWGLINYQIDPKTKSSIVGPQYTGHFQITLDTPTGLLPLVPEDSTVGVKEDNTVGSDQPQDKGVKEEKPIPLNLEYRKNIYTTANSKVTGKNNTIVQYFCNVCGKDTTNVRYHNLKIKTYSHNSSSTINNASILCDLCYEQGLFPSNFQTSDFVKLSKNDELKDWTEQEVLLLLEGIEMFATFDQANGSNGSIYSNHNSQWEKISEHVSSKTKEQCIVKFIQLPIEDKFLTRLTSPKANKTSDSEVNESLLGEIVKKLIKQNEGKELIQENSKKNLQESLDLQTSLINQITELTLEKFNKKVQKLDSLQESLLRTENQLNLERKQVLIERWVQFEKIQKLKQERPELADILDDLIKPTRVNEIVKPTSNTDNGDAMEVDNNVKDTSDADKLPISVSKPKSYQYWSG